MRKVIDEGTVERSDQLGNRWIANWVAWEDEIERRVEIKYRDKTASITITNAQNIPEARAKVAGMMFENLLRELGHSPEGE